MNRPVVRPAPHAQAARRPRPTRAALPLAVAMMVSLLGLGLAPGTATGAAAGTIAAVTETGTESYFHNEEIAVAELDPTGLSEQTTVIGRISSRGIPEQEVLDPFTTANVEFLDQRGSPEIGPDGVKVAVGGPEPKSILLQGLMDKPLPVALHAEYRLDGEVIDPGAVLGSAGELTVKFTITNVDVKEQPVSYTDAAGRRTTENLPVFAPLTGNLVTRLPASWEPVKTSDASLSTNENGETVLKWDLVLYPPLGDFTQEVSYRARMDTGSIPGTTLTLAAAGTEKNPAGAFSQDLLEKTAEGNSELRDGVDVLNENTLALADGVAGLSDGLTQLSQGAAAGSESVDGELVPGTRQLADGAAALAQGQSALAQALGRATAGATGLTDGAGELAAGMTELGTALEKMAGDGLPRVAEGAESIRDGAEQLADAVGAGDKDPGAPDPPDPLPTGLPTPDLPTSPTPIPTPSGSPVFPEPTATPTQTPTLYEATELALSGTKLLRDQLVQLNNDLIPVLDALEASATDSDEAAASADDAAARLGPLYAALCAPALNPPSPAQCDELKLAEQQAAAAGTRSSRIAEDLRATHADLAVSSLRAYLSAAGSDLMLEVLRQIRSGVAQVGQAIRSGSTDPGQEGIVEGLTALEAGLGLTIDATEQLADGADQLADGTDDLASGANQLSEGLTEAESGSRTLAEAAADLATGADLAAFGTAEVAAALDDLAAGLGEAADGADQLADGAGTLQQEGTRELLDNVISSSQKPAQAVAYLNAANSRADTAMPYGPPKGATGSAAYILTMAPVEPDSSSNWLLFGLAVLVAAAVGGAVVKQLRRTAGA